ncbi:MAG: hypothetical protein WBF02_11370, partial [Xanthobacteraceae bacterium]
DQKNVTDRDVAIDNRVPWLQVANENSITFAIVAYQFASQRGKGSGVIVGANRGASHIDFCL